MKYRLVNCLVLFLLLGCAQAHESDSHENSKKIESSNKTSLVDEDGYEIISRGPSKEQLKNINELYKNHVQDIFKQKCFDCHGVVDALPWYAKLPGSKQLIEKDVREAKEHMDMSNGFPFQGHGAPVDDLNAIARVLKENSMPPLRYKMMHWWSGLTKKEKYEIQKWILESKNILKKEKSK